MQLAPDMHQAQLQMGSVLYKEDRLRESVQHYKIAVALAPQDRCAPTMSTHVPLCICSVQLLAVTVACEQADAAFIGQHTGRRLQTGGKRVAMLMHSTHSLLCAHRGSAAPC